MKVLIVGAGGQLGRELVQCAPTAHTCVTATRSQLDILSVKAVQDFVQEHQPQLIYNCAAYTAVDGAETKPDLAVAINAEAVAGLAKAAAQIGARIVHVSTDFVFDGEATTPYPSDAETRPLGVYGHSKLAGEMRLQEILPLDSLIFRTSWLYSCHEGNFVTTMLRLMNERSDLRVVSDQIGSPTWVRGLAKTMWAVADQPQAHGIYHWTDNDSCSWYEFACAIYEQGRRRGLIETEVAIEAISTEEYPTAAQRPAYSVLDCQRSHALLGVTGEPWRFQLEKMMKEMSAHD
jgi:dTDP-4-dehydrorhamnose reductase